MTATHVLRTLACATVLCAFAAGAAAQKADAPAVAAPPAPSVGQAGKDVVWVPTPQALVDRMLDLAKVTSRDTVIDLGSGDGRTVVTAAKRGARALGIEYNPDMVTLARERARREGVAERARFEKQDLFTTDLSPATVITMFLLTDINLKLRPKLLELKPGTRVVSNTFTMGEWEPDATATLTPAQCADAWCTALLWIVPARVAGTHATPRGELTLEQTFQKVSGTLKTENGTVPVTGTVRGEEVVLQAGGRTLRGTAGGRGLELK